MGLLPDGRLWRHRPRHHRHDPDGPFLKGGRVGTILLVILVLMLLGAIPRWPHSRSWGYGPSGGLGLVLIILLILVLTGRL